MNLTDDDLRNAYYCASKLIRTLSVVPTWLNQHQQRLDAAFRMSVAGHASGWGPRELKQEQWITTREAAVIVKKSPRHVRRIKADLGGEIRGDRLVYPLSAVKEYAEGRESA